MKGGVFTLKDRDAHEGRQAWQRREANAVRLGPEEEPGAARVQGCEGREGNLK